jgi:general secretion pathway protein D
VGGQGQQSNFAGTGFTIFPENGGFIYRGTDAQHERVAALVDQLKDLSARDEVILEFYKLKHGKSTDVAEVVQNLITNSTPTGNRGGGLLARESDAGRSRAQRAQPPANQPGTPAGSAAPADGALGDLAGEDVFVIADEPNNQVIVKAPRKLQPQFRTLISRIDLRRPQVYIDAKIVAVSYSDDFRLAVEAQQIIGQFALNTNFGLGTLPANPTTTTGNVPQGIESRKNVATNLGGLTSALIRSKDVPIIINALARNIDTRIVATPQLLVDDNEEAKISSVDKQPTSTTSQSGQAGSTITSFGGFEEAGPKLTVTPQISEGGYLRMEYTIELSSFQGSATGNLPPPKQENKIESKSVTIPTDATIVIGGLTFQQDGRTVVKVPLLGDIPLIGQLFRDESTSKRTTTLYVFITPKIMRDPSFADLRLITKAPLAEVKLPGEFPPPEAEAIPLIKTFEFQQREREREAAETNRMPEPESPAGKPAPADRDRSAPRRPWSNQKDAG